MTSNQKTFGFYFEKLSTTTVIRVFNFIRTSTFVVERLFWILVLLGFSGATVWSVTRTIQTFLSEPTASHVTFLSNSSDGLTLSDAMFCMETRTDILLKLCENKIDDVLAYTNTPNFFGQLKAKLDRALDIENKRGLSMQNLSSSAEGSESSLKTYHQFEVSQFEVFNEDEIALLGLTTAMFFRLFGLEMNPSAVERVPASSSILKLHHAYVSRGTDFNELLRLTAAMMCVVLQVRLIRFQLGMNIESNRYSAYNLCTSPLLFMGENEAYKEVICYRFGDVGETPLAFHSTYDYVTLTMHTEALFKRDAVELHLLQLDLGGRYAVLQQPPLEVSLNEKQTVEFSLDTISTSANLRRSACWNSPKGTFTQCGLWCAVEALVWACGCSPLTRGVVPKFEELPRGLRSCALVADNELENLGDVRCRRAIPPTFKFENCSQECFERDCKVYLFTSAAGRVDVKNDLNATTIVKLRPTKLVYAQVDEYLTMNAIQLVTSLGGNLSLYLGASFLALIHIIVFFVKLPFEFIDRSRADGSSSIDAKEPQLVTATDLAHEMALLRAEFRQEILHHSKRCEGSRETIVTYRL